MTEPHALPVFMPEEMQGYYMEASDYLKGKLVEGCMDALASKFYGKEYVGQQTGGCLPRGLYISNIASPYAKDLADEWRETKDQWLANPYENDQFGIDSKREAPSIDNTLYYMMEAGVIPSGTYYINIDW